MKSLALGLVALLLLAVGIWLFGSSGPARSATAEPRAGVAVEGTRVARQMPALEAELSMDVDATGAGSAVSWREVAGGAIGPTLRRFFGKLECLDENGWTVSAPNATIAFTFATRTHTVAVTGGQFEGELVGDASTPVELESIEIPGEQIAIEPLDQELALDGSAWTIKVRILPHITLHVRDAATGAELEGVLLMVDRDDFGETLPGLDAGDESSVFQSSSPIELAPLPEELRNCRGQLLVSAQGYAWTHFRFDPHHSSEPTVNLEPGANVIVETRLPQRGPEERLQIAFAKMGQGTESPGRTSLRLIRKEDPQAGQFAEVPELPDGRQESLFSGLIPGTYRIELRHTREDQSWLLGHLDVRLDPGPNARVLLDVPSLEPPPLPADEGVQVTIHLTLPGAWSELTETVELTLKSAPGIEGRSALNLEREREGPETWRFTNDKVPPGTYVLMGENPHFLQQLEVPRNGLETRLEFPRGYAITLRVIDAATGEPDPIGQLRFHAKLGQGEPGYISGDASPGATPGEFTAIVPSGTVSIRPISDRAINQNTIEVQTAGQVFLLETVQPLPVELFLDTGGQALSQEALGDVFSHLVLEGPGRFTSITLSSSVYEMLVTVPGTYTLVVRDAELFKDTRTKAVEVPGDKSTRFNLKLEAR